MADIGIRLGLEGEKEFKKALSDINQQFKVLGSEMKLVSSQFDKNDTSVQALTARNTVLSIEIEAQKSKIETLRQALENAATSFGEADRRTQNWRIQLNNAEAALNDMERELEGNNAALHEAEDSFDDTGDAAEEAGEKTEDAGKKADDSKSHWKALGSVLKTVGAAMVTATAAAAAGAYSLGKAVVSAYADYEQLAGGVETLFKESGGTVKEYANIAYRTAGLSANEYLETVTGFSASLIQSVGGDTEKAAKLADQAIIDMADNANKMGSDIGTIQTAYAGFAKQNYSMLDNLKLGYGGTKSEMERLLSDAQKLKAAQGEYVEYSIDSYADVVEAIHVVQDNMGITGATAKEATETVSGSIGALKSSFQNFITGLGDAGADVSGLALETVSAFQTVTKNVTPIIQNLVSALPDAVSAVAAAFTDILPGLLETAVNIFSEILSTLVSLFPALIPVITDAVMMVISTLIDNLPAVIDGGVQLILALVTGIGAALPELIPAIVNAIVLIAETLVGHLDEILTAAFAIIEGLAQGLLDALPQLMEALPQIIAAIVSFIAGHLPEFVEMGFEILYMLGVGLLEAIPDLLLAIPEILGALIGGLTEGIAPIFGIGEDIVKGLWDGIKSLTSWIGDKVKGFFGGIVDDAKSFLGIHSPSRVFAGIGENMGLGVGEGFTDAMKDVEKDIENAIPTDFGFAASADLGTVVPNFRQEVTTVVEHTGTIRVEGISTSGELVDVVDILVSQMKREARI